METKQEVNDVGFSERFGQFLKAADLNTNSLATRLNDTNPVKFRRWLAGEVAPNYKELVNIATYFKLSLDWLAFGVGTMERSEEAEISQPEPKIEQKTPNNPSDSMSADDFKELIQLRIENQFQKNRIKELEDQVEYFRPDRETLHGAIKTANENFLALTNEPQDKIYSEPESDHKMMLVLANLRTAKFATD